MKVGKKVLYCDCLTIGACLKVIRLCWRDLLSRRKVCHIQVLDSLPQRGCQAIIGRIMQSFGFRVQEAMFFAGHLRTPEGQVVFTEARRISIDLALNAAERLVRRSKHMAALNKKWGRKVIFKQLARSLELPAAQMVLRLLAAEALGRKSGEERLFLIVQHFPGLDTDLLRGLCPSLDLTFYRPWICLCKGAVFFPSGFSEVIRRKRASVLFLILFFGLRELKWILESLILGRSYFKKRSGRLNPDMPSLMLLQEDELSQDRSYRTQPHWLFREDGKPGFRTFILRTGGAAQMSFDLDAPEGQGLFPISMQDLYVCSRKHRSPNAIYRELRKGIWKCLAASLFASAVEMRFVFEFARIFYSAYRLAAFCERYQVRAFMTCENYLSEATAMQCIAASCGIKTISYQYSNMGKLSPMMTTGSDFMLTFSRQYHERWIYKSLRPRAFVDIGYLYDTSFKYLHGRARELRDRLGMAGAKFVLCYFPENAVRDKYTLISEEDYCAEIQTLLRLVLSDPTIGLLLKGQFQKSSSRYIKEISGLHAQAEATGRHIELTYGTHRNIIFPAEAALSSDITIGHMVGATASLEAALTGTRSLILNPYGIEGDNDGLYAQADIVYSSMEAALEAISRFRSGDPERAELGDWSPIIEHFDSFRDGQSGTRMRGFLETVVGQRDGHRLNPEVSRALFEGQGQEGFGQKRHESRRIQMGMSRS